ncbi:putative toxin-antitoxin system toxin component, PIN family [bacterium]|nr:putative toxin-antitoxin system toxin component, PIN family [bacterium]
MKPVVLLDTNVWVSAFLNEHGLPARVVRAWLAGDYDVVIGLPVLEEIGEVLRRPRIKRKYKIREEDLAQYLQLIAAGAAIVAVKHTMKLCRDPDDDVLLEIAVAGGARYLVTRDDDLKRDLDLVRQMAQSGVQVVSVLQFLARL